jgi:hypothetical protein
MVINYQDNNTSSITLERVALKTAKDYYNDDENGDTARKTANFFCCNLQQIMQLPVMQFISYTSVGYDGVQVRGIVSRVVLDHFTYADSYFSFSVKAVRPRNKGIGMR